MADRELTISLNIDKTRARAASAQFHAEERERIAGTAQASAQGSERSAQAGIKGFQSMGIAAGLAQVGIMKLIDAAQALGAAIERAAEKQRAMTKGFVDSRDQLGELAALMGRTADSAFTLDIAKFGARTGMRSDESRQFLTELYNAGAQFKGQTISGPEFEQFGQQAAQLGAARGYEPGSFGDIAGTTLGFGDYNKFGAGASEEALSRLNKSMGILQHGKGRSQVLANQFSMLTSSALNEDEMLGTFTNVEDAAIAISIAAEKHDAQAAELTKIATRGLRGFGAADKQAPLLREAGITPQTGFLQSLAQLSPIVQRQAEAGNVSTQDVLGKYFDQAEAEAIGVFVNKGVIGGGIAERRQFAAGMGGPESALGDIQGYLTSERGQTRLAEADVNFAQMQRGAEDAGPDTLRRQAAARLIRNKQLATTSSELKDFLVGAGGFSPLGSGEQVRIDEEAQRLLQERGGAAPSFASYLNVTPQARTEDLREQMEAMRQQGLDPMTDRTGEVVNILGEIRDALKARPAEQRPRQAPVLQARPQAPPARLPANG